jgi:hypothetical protein
VPAYRIRPQLVELGDRTLPSAVTSLPVYVGPHSSVSTHPLHGTGSGIYGGLQIIVDTGNSFTLTGTVELRDLGSFTVTGGVQGVGMIASGRATGELTLTNAHGTITLALHGAVQSAFSQPPSTLVYSVTGGTGAFRHLTGYGTVDMHRVPAPVSFGHPQTGTITLTFS